MTYCDRENGCIVCDRELCDGKRSRKAKMNRDEVISHLQIIHVWASFALEHDLNFFNEKHLKSIAEWTDDALELLKEQDGLKHYDDGSAEP